MKVNIRKNELARKRSDYKFTWQDPNDGKTRIENCDFRPNGERLPFRKSELAKEAESDKRKHFGWKVFPRYSYTVELLESYRDDTGKPNNRFLWSKTFNPHSTSATPESKGKEIKRRLDFWTELERQLLKHKVEAHNADRIRKQVAEAIPVVTKKELATMEADSAKRERSRAFFDKYGR